MTAAFGCQGSTTASIVATHNGVRMNADAQDMIATTERVFAALGDNDQTRLNELLCEDFHAFENGVQVTGRELLDLMSRYHAEGRRYRWSVNSPQVESQGNLGILVYVNSGSITESGSSDPIPMSWLETVLLRRRPAGWRVAFLHSTRSATVQHAA
jgi:ketosteroid isomerase-like protein